MVPRNDLDGAENLGESLREAIQKKAIFHPNSECAEVLTVSVGVATCRPHLGALKTDLLKVADEQLYEAKKSGRNRVCGSYVNEPMAAEP